MENTIHVPEHSGLGATANAGIAGLTDRLRPWRIVVALRAMIERDRQRRALARLDDRLLGDVGLDRESVRRELAKPFWRD